MTAAGHDANRTHDFPVAGLYRGRSYFLHLCLECGERRILEVVQAPRACPCSKAKTGVFRAPRTAAGRRMLERFRPGRAGRA